MKPGSAGGASASSVAPALPTTPPAPVGMSPTVPAVIAAVSALLLLWLTIWRVSYGDGVPAFDAQIHTWVLGHRSDESETLARAVTWLGAVVVVVPTLFLLGCAAARAGSSITKRLRTGLLVAALPGIGMMLGLRLNAELGRARPSVADWLSAAGGPSYPSGHTTAATLFFGSVALLAAARTQRGWHRVLIWAIAAVGAILVGWSRVWLGVHWPTDVLAGWLCGTSWSALTVWLTLLQRRVVSRRLLRRQSPAARKS